MYNDFIYLRSNGDNGVRCYTVPEGDGDFVEAVNVLLDFVKKQKEQDLEKIIQDEKLKYDEAQKFIENSFREGEIKTTGTAIDKILPPISRFSGGSNRAFKKQTVIDKLKVFFEKYFGVI